MKLYSWNVNGIRAVWNKGKFQEFAETHQPDILCLQETKAQPDQSPVDIEGYQEIYNSAERRGHFGTAIFSKISPLRTFDNIPEDIASKYALADKYGNTNQEGRVLVAEFDDYYVATVYTPNSKDDLTRLKLRADAWGPAFTEYMASLEAKKPVLVSGDFNVAHNEIDLARPKQNVGKHGFTDEERQDFTKLLEIGLCDSFRTLYPDTTEAYTWWTAWGNARANNVGWRIDYWLVSNQLMPKLVDAQIHPDVLGSDHCPVSIEL
ncbi:exodeoxyribonuclease III [Candidatus Saccharibacteria bacterium]|nr:exodeoxyribonuclease III [Candidatus Saccharibacteria bacterium]MCB9821429.1 exodeoxyribonuclease III [Candidatus Nomurabacteria bacterium]